jgi:hypothetical protein
VGRREGDAYLVRLVEPTAGGERHVAAASVASRLNAMSRADAVPVEVAEGGALAGEEVRDVFVKMPYKGGEGSGG